MAGLLDFVSNCTVLFSLILTILKGLINVLYPKFFCFIVKSSIDILITRAALKNVKS